MPDGKRKRRHSPDEAKRRWYAIHRSRRFRRRFWLLASKSERPSSDLELLRLLAQRRTNRGTMV